VLGKIGRDALLFATAIDPIGTVVLFAALAAGRPPAARRRIAVQAALYAAIILLLSIVLGQVILTGLGIRLISLQVAGGIILFLFGLQMVFRSSGTGEDVRPESGHDVAVFPLAIPGIAGPGAIMAVIVATDREVHTLAQQATSALVLLGVLLVTLGMMLAAERIVRLLGRHGSEIVVRVMGMLLAALSVELVMDALGVAAWSGPVR
jgi:multiple antibiotic resistance protein